MSKIKCCVDQLRSPTDYEQHTAADDDSPTNYRKSGEKPADIPTKARRVYEKQVGLA
jgi:hypothetical protein